MTGAMLVIAAVLLGTLWWLIASRRKNVGPASPNLLSDGATVESKQLLTEGELSLYNLLQIAVQDHYLIFAQVPLWAFVSLEAAGKNRSRLLKYLALRRVSFALMHPGSRRVELVVHIVEESPTPLQEEHQRIIESFVEGAGVRLVKVQAQHSYTIPELTALLGLAADE